MSNDGDASKRLSDALDQIFSGTKRTSSPADVRDATPDEPYELPEIVSATEEPTAQHPPVAAPTLPARVDVPGQASNRTAASSPRQAAAPAMTPAAAPAPAASNQPVAPSTVPTTSWADHVTAVPSNARSAGLRAPGRKPRVRRVTRVLRHIDPWSTFKVALLFSLVAYLVALTSGVLLWRVAESTGTLDNIERWFTQFGWETFELKGGEIFHNAWIIGLFGVVAMTGGLVLLATVFNLVSDIIGGVRLTVLEEEVVERTVTSTRRYVVRHGAAAAGAVAPAQQWDVDDDPDPVEEAAEPEPEPTPAAAGADWSVDD
ncbi:MAG TPA: DUF3566 domain-containing protein [Ilumatobacter sp.]|nr:DUF3566 domain-containing protein [Ilumatobacter sp.]